MGLLERDAALSRLSGAYARAREGRGCVAVVSGEAGIGKTSLVTAFAALHAGGEILWGRCDSLATPRVHGPAYDIASRRGGRLLECLDKGAGRTTLFGAFLGEMQRAPAIFVFEDLHWADSALVDFVEELTDWWRARPILVITMARPDLLDLRPSWGTGRQGVISITLGPLADGQMAELVHGAVPGLPEQAGAVIVERAAGVPLYAVELLRGLLAQGELVGEAGDYRVVGDLTRMVVP